MYTLHSIIDDEKGNSSVIFSEFRNLPTYMTEKYLTEKWYAKLISEKNVRDSFDTDDNV